MERQLWAPWRISYILGPKPDECVFCIPDTEEEDEERLILHRGKNCFVIPEAPAHLSPEARDRSDRDNFYNILDDKILPLYYDHNDKWMDIVFNAMTDIYPEFDSDRMADQYYTEMYNS